MTTTDDRPTVRLDGEPTVKSAERVLRILEVLGASPVPMTVPELHRATGYPRSSLHHLVHTMTALGWIEQSSDGARIAIGSRALLVGTSYLDRDPALAFAVRTLELIRDRCGYTTHYARLDGPNVLYLATRTAVEAHRATSRVGRQLPAGLTALGKAMLAELTDGEVSALLPDPLPTLTAESVADRPALLRQLAEVRGRGYSVERQENTLGVSCVGVVVPYRIPATDAISCSIPLARASDREVTTVARVLREETADLAAQLRAEGIR